MWTPARVAMGDLVPQSLPPVNDPAAFGPATLVSPMPTITPPNPGTISDLGVGALCDLAAWVQANPPLAFGAAVLVYALIARGKGGRG